MKSFGYEVLIISAVSFFFTNIAFAQGSEEKSKERKPDFIFFTLGNKNVAINAKKLIVYGKEDDGFPNEVKAKGTIVKANTSGRLCGTFANAGTLKIKLDEKNEGYKDDYLYVIVLCLFSTKDGEEFLNKRIEVSAKKLIKYPYTFDVMLSNNLDTKGIPFYLSDDEGYEIEQKIGFQRPFKNL